MRATSAKNTASNLAARFYPSLQLVEVDVLARRWARRAGSLLQDFHRFDPLRALVFGGEKERIALSALVHQLQRQLRQKQDQLTLLRDASQLQLQRRRRDVA